MSPPAWFLILVFAGKVKQCQALKKSAHGTETMDSDKTAIMLLREIHAAVYGNGRAGLQERVTRLETRAERTPKAKGSILKLSIGTGALTSLSNVYHFPQITIAGAIVSGLLGAIWFVLDWQEKHGQ